MGIDTRHKFLENVYPHLNVNISLDTSAYRMQFCVIKISISYSQLVPYQKLT